MGIRFVCSVALLPPLRLASRTHTNTSGLRRSSVRQMAACSRSCRRPQTCTVAALCSWLPGSPARRRPACPCLLRGREPEYWHLGRSKPSRKRQRGSGISLQIPHLVLREGALFCRCCLCVSALVPTHLRQRGRELCLATASGRQTSPKT